MLEAKLNYRSLLRIGNDITEWLSHDEAVKQVKQSRYRPGQAQRVPGS